jgi:hypothetical protein
MRTNPIAYPDVGRVTVCTTATRPTGTRRYEGKVIWDTDVDALLVYTGGSWTSLNGPRGSHGLRAARPPRSSQGCHDG